MKQRIKGLHKMALAALFTVGNALIRYPWKMNEGSVLYLFLLSAAGALIPAFLLYPAFRAILRSPLSRRPWKRFWVGVLSVLLFGYALYCCARSCGDYVEFSMKLALPTGSRFWLTAVFLLCAGWLSSLSDQSMDSFALLAFVGVLFCIAVLFLAGLPHFRWEYAKGDFFRWDASVWKSLPVIWRESLLPLTLLSVYFALTVPRGGEKALAVGTGIGCLLLFACVMQAVLTFGVHYAAELAYPYSYSVRILSVGQYFFRLEGFSYLLDYLSCLMRCTVSLAVAKRLAARFSPRIGKRIPLVASAALLGILQI